MPAASGSDFSSLLASLPLRSALLTDQEGVVLLRTAPAAADELDLQRMAATFAQTAEHAGKLGMGKNRHATAFYGAQDCAVAPPLLHHLDSTTRVAPFEHVPRAPLSLSLACRVPQTRRSSCMSAARRSYSR